MNISSMKEIEGKFLKMRKPQSFIVYPRKDENEPITVQSDKSIGQFDPATGKGKLNVKGCYFHHLILGAVDFQFPADFVEACKAQKPVKETIIA